MNPKNTIVRWKDIETSKPKDYGDILFSEFRTNREFHDFVISIVKENPKIGRKILTPEEYDRLAEYVLLELPIYINGAEYQGRRYLLQPYPGLGRIDKLIMGLQNGTLFPDLAKKIDLTDKIAIIEAYAD